MTLFQREAWFLFIVFKGYLEVLLLLQLIVSTRCLRPSKFLSLTPFQ